MSFSTFSLLKIQGGTRLMGGHSSSRSSSIWAPLMLTKRWRRPRPLGGVTWSKVMTNHEIVTWSKVMTNHEIVQQPGIPV
jgi:hypothetical protein